MNSVSPELRQEAPHCHVLIVLPYIRELQILIFAGCEKVIAMEVGVSRDSTVAYELVNLLALVRND
jgi:hypothetical protein